MKFKSLSKNLINSSSIAVIYFLCCTAYIIFSDFVVLFFFGEDVSKEALIEIQSYKGVIFVLLSSLLIYFLLKKRDSILKLKTSNLKENQKRCQEELEESKRQINESFKKNQFSEFLLKQASNIAKIGYWSYDSQTHAIFWSEEIYNIYGITPEEGVLEFEEILNFFTKESKKELIQATIELD